MPCYTYNRLHVITVNLKKRPVLQMRDFSCTINAPDIAKYMTSIIIRNGVRRSFVAYHNIALAVKYLPPTFQGQAIFDILEYLQHFLQHHFQNTLKHHPTRLCIV